MAKSENEIKKEIEIKKGISECTKTKNNAQNELNKYNNALDYANKMKSLLEQVCVIFEEIKEGLERNFIINGKMGDDGRTDKLYEEVKGSLKDLEKLIIPEIEKKIRDCKSTIYSMERKIGNFKKQL